MKQSPRGGTHVRLLAVVRTYALRGQTPVLRAPDTRDHRSGISAITPGGHLVVHEQERALRGADVVGFLRQVLRCIPGKLRVLWDDASIPRNQDVKTVLAVGTPPHLQREPLPVDAPELNLDESIWQYLTRVELRNRCCPDLAEPPWELGLAVRRLRRKRQVIQGCFRQCGFPV